MFLIKKGPHPCEPNTLKTLIYHDTLIISFANLTSHGHFSNSDQSNGLGCSDLAGLYPGSARRFSYAFLRFNSLSSLLLQYEHVLSRYSPPFRLKSSINSAPFLGLKHFSCRAHVMPPCVLMFMCTRFAIVAPLLNV